MTIPFIVRISYILYPAFLAHDKGVTDYRYIVYCNSTNVMLRTLHGDVIVCDACSEILCSLLTREII